MEDEEGRLGVRLLASQATPLVETKLVAPRSHPNMVSRQRLERQLDEFAPAALTLVDAPVGFGKTMLVQSWCAARSSGVAWVSLDAADNDPARLWTYVATAIDRVRSGLGRSTLQRLRVPGAALGRAIEELAQALETYGRPLVIVLDDLHALSSEWSIGSVEYFLGCIPSGVRVVATTRTDPPIHMAQMRVRGALAEIRSQDLAFTADEARELFVGLELLDLTDSDVEQLVERTEGWPAGLYLSALWLRDRDNRHARVREFAGDNRHVAGYLTGEVLDKVPPERRDFLLRTSVLERFTAPLCDAVLGRSDSLIMLDELARSNLFLVSLDTRGEWYRYHHLFAELLQLELAHSDATAPSALRRRASDWFRERRLIADAAQHAAAAGDAETVVNLMAEHQVRLLESGREATLLRWIEWLPEERLAERPETLAGAAVAAGLLRRPAAERQRYLARADRARGTHPSRWTPYAEATYSMARAIWIDGDVGEAVASARVGVEVTRERASALVVLASLSYALYLAGDTAGARDLLDQILRHPDFDERPHGTVISLATLALIEADEGNVGPAEARARAALERAVSQGIDETWTGAIAYVALASALSVAGRLPEAEAAAERGEQLRRAAEPTIENTQARLVLAGIRAARGHLSQAAADLEEARSALETFRDAGYLTILADHVQQTLAEARATQREEPLAELPTAAELTVLHRLPTELSLREIGAELFLSHNTIKTHTRELYRKLGVGSRHEAIARAAALGLLDRANHPG